MAKTNEDVLEFSVAVDIRDALKEMTRVQAQVAKLTKEILKSSGRTSKEQTKTTKKSKQQTREVKDSVGDLADAYEEEGKQVSNLTRTITVLEKRVKKLTGTERDAAEARLAALKKEAAKQAEAAGGKAGKPRKPKAPADYGFNRKNVKKFKAEFKELGAALKEPLEAFLQRDLKGLLEGSMKGAGATLSRSLKLSRFLSGAGAEALSKRGEQMSFKGKAAGGRKGAMLEAGGAGMKRMGSMMGQIGNAMGGLAKLGPIIGMASGAMMSLVKLFLDADASVKEFNKGILDSAGNLSIFERSGREATAAGLNLEGTLKELRDAAFDYKTNLSLGITKEEHKAMLNTLNQEGVSLGRIEDEAQLAGKSVRDLATQFTVTGVAYSRAFGVSLAEVGQFQAEMMTEMGKSADETQKAFALMARGAAESGISSNKFFAAIRGISPDLGLFNLRLEDSVAVLSKISKVMSPRNAQKFMQEAVSGLKTMGRQEKLRLSLFAGSGKTKGIVERDIKRKTEALIKSISEKTGEKADDLRNAFEKQGYAGLKKSIDKLGPEVSGSIAESAIDLQLQKSQASKGQYGTAMATADLGVGGGLELQQQALMVFSKGAYKSISDALGSMGLENVAEGLGKSDEQVKQLAKLEVAINAQRAELISQGKKADEVNAMGYDEIIDSMSADMQKSLTGQDDGLSMDKKMEKLAQAQGKLTQSILDQFQVLMDWLTNQFYSLMMDIWDAITSIPGVGGKNLKEKRALYKSGDSGLIKAFDKSLDKSGKLDARAFIGTVSPLLSEKLGVLGQSADARKKVAQSVGSVSSNVNEMGEDYALAHGKARILDMGKASGLDPGKFTALQNKLGSVNLDENGDIDLMKVMKDVGLDTEEQTKLLSQALQGVNLTDLIGLSKALGGTAGTPPGSPAKVTAESSEATNEQLESANETANKQQNLLKQQGIKIAPATIKETNKGVEVSMLSALRTALFEFYMYSATDRGTMLAAMKSGGAGPSQVGPAFTAGAMAGSSPLAGVTALSTPAPASPNATGGRVTGIANGMAVVASHGEGLASVGRGERIVPAGGGGGPNVHVSVNGIGGQDLQRLIEGKVTDGIREYKRRERLY